MNKLPLEKRVQILGMLVEGMSLRAVSRLSGCSINTVTKLLVDAGKACEAYHDEHVRGLGGLKLHFPTTSPLNKESAEYVSVVVQEYVSRQCADDGSASHRLCSVIDVGSGKVYQGPQNIRQRMRDVEAARAQIHSLWPSIRK